MKLLSYLRLELNTKVGLLPSKSFIFVYFNESPFKMIKNAQARQKIITTHILLKISTSKGNQTMKFGQLIKYNMKNILFKNSYTNYGGEASSRPFYNKSKLSIFLGQQSEML